MRERRPAMSVDRIQRFAFACASALLLAWLPPASAQQPQQGPQGPPPPPVSDVCPRIEEDGLLCSADLLSGNCADFVAAADRLGTLYRNELAQMPGSEGPLLSTTWWGCGPGNLFDITALLERIGSPRALAVLQTPPYATIVAQRASAPAAPPPPANAPAPDCDALSGSLARNSCIGAQLQAAR